MAEPKKTGKSIDDAISTSIADIDAVIDAGKATALISQRDALTEQRRALTEQINALNKQITDSESEEVKKARMTKQILELANSPGGLERLRRMGGI